MYNKKEYDKQWKIEHPEKVKEYRKRYKEKHPEKVKAYKKEWRKKNWDRIKEKLRERWKNRYKDCPWLKHLRYARYRCSSSGPYYKNGTKCLLTKEEIKDLWFRDKAYLLNKPSIDRKNAKGNYTSKNCRFIERGENTRISNLTRFHKHT